MTTKRLAEISTFYNAGGGEVKVDTYTLGSTLNIQNEPVLQLDSITRTGYDAAGGSIATPPVTFTYSHVVDNRVYGYETDHGVFPPMKFARMSNIRTETGADIAIDYTNHVDTDQPACTATNVPTDLPNNKRLCYPVRRTLPYNEGTSLDFFHKYVVKQVRVQDTTSGSPTQITDYSYKNAAWHYDDNELVKPADRTYGQFRGFATVETRAGNTGHTPPDSGGAGADKRTYTKSLFFQGMHEDPLPDNVKRDVKVKNSLNEEVHDLDQYAGAAFETQTFNGDGGALLSKTITNPITIASNVTRTRTGLPDLVATITATERTRQFTERRTPPGVTEPTPPLVATTVARYDSTGRVIAETSSATGLPDQCATTEYATHPTITNQVKQTVASTGACPASGEPQTSITAATRTSTTAPPPSVRSPAPPTSPASTPPPLPTPTVSPCTRPPGPQPSTPPGAPCP
ncbi:hypothetical protein GPZ80_31750 [Actinokineospora sp. HBU206404]|uniref:YD repeat-containing protein n=1 Tax=Actinokineospora xionganensis TaxID=2684470 RepID=A0ABR7LGF3_9PSEU|nr:hypothetical protein [Actinokineospora xionganensis]